ncbi:class I SAM-dependent methyltransferase [Nocardia farcinica]|uniref:THUMP-like domain-containing protein n=1 Tax=Nocardia farcinica TaxID=37329 RepID=UPI001894BC7A|nr:class I SAM-dependent methyltransferase [Nocardia farcinica]MBF6261655.1 class I SAM-dependent methyltransferase [Nocardia farcinica]MBF6280194.1 class I SAM-dependent methyltransferase [Nocardia farcinica]MBF6305350.1 class I SAM-dependent methyltransferase [Nocardia farcinica]MBF6391581.1 class I SAM-dependent methyltransferase [Nocardia farcinica]MBF6493780.1 class I SAM-dependent methyltransferase [Nocardia farcinica]
MGYGFGRADVAFLASAAGRAALAEVAGLELSAASHLHDLERVRRAHGAAAPALIETVRLRRKATAKLADAADWLLTDDAVQQATPTAVARHRARRLAGRAVHDVTCSIGAELAELAPACPAVIGSDLDEVRLAMAAHNLGGAANVLLARADALAPVTRDTVVVADPARRAGGRRTHDPAALQPPLPDLLSVYAGRDLAVKCAPGLDFARLDWAGEVEVVSLDGAVREACLWSPGLAEPGVRRRATVLSTTGPGITLTDTEPDDIPQRPPGAWIIDPDGAIVRAGLVRHYAAKHGLWQLDPQIAYLTGDRVPPGVRGFRIDDRLDLREKTLRRELTRRDCGALEILVRGVEIDPDALRKRLKLRGTRPYTLVLTRIGRTATAFLCTAQAPADRHSLR